MKAPLALALLLAGCLAPTDPVLSPAALPDAPAGPPAAQDVRYSGEIGTYACTYGDLRHACDGLPGEEEFHVLDFARVVRLSGDVTLGDSAQETPRVDLFVVHRPPGGEWTYVFPDDPYVSGPSPQDFDFDLSGYVDEELALYVFASHAAWLQVSGVSVSPPQRFAVEAVATAG